MRQNTRNLLIPIIGSLVAAAIYTGVVLLFAFDLETGSAAEWVSALGAVTVGLVAAAFAGLAWTEAKIATAATERAMNAQEHNNFLMEQQLASVVVFSIEAVSRWSNAYILELKLSEGSPQVWIRTATTGGSFGGDMPPGGPVDQLDRWMDGVNSACEMFRGKHLAPGGIIRTLWVYGDHNPWDAERFKAQVVVNYTVTAGPDANEFRSPPTAIDVPEGLEERLAF